MIRRSTMLVMLCMVTWVSLRAQVWERIDAPSGGEFNGFTVVEADGWTIVFSDSRIWRTRTPEQLGTLTRTTVRVNGEETMLRSMVVHRGVIIAHSNNRFVTSTDAGVTWTDMTLTWPIACSLTPGWQPIGLAATPEVLYIWCQHSGPWRSTDAGATWFDLRDPFGAQAPGLVQDAAFGPTTVAAIHSFDDTLRLSVTNDGFTWTECTMPSGGPGTVFAYNRVFVGAENVLYVNGTITGSTPVFATFRSTDRGTTWSRVTAFDGSLPFITTYRDVDLTNNIIVRSSDRGETWTPFQGNIPDIVVNLSIAGRYLIASTNNRLYRIALDSVTSVDESVGGSRFAVHGEQYMRGGVPYTNVHVETDADIEIYNVLGERISSQRLVAGEHTLHTPEPCVLVRRP